jgi:hypothetical protein
VAAASFRIWFHEHLPQEQVSNLKGILQSSGLAQEGTDASTLDVHRKSKVSHVAITLNNWAASGWVSKWSSEPPLQQQAR